MKILFMVNQYRTMFNFRYELAKRLLDDGHEIVVTAPNMEGIERLKTELGCDYRTVPLSRRGTNPKEDFKLLQAYKRIIREVKPDVALTFTIKPNIYGSMACKKYKVPCIVNITGLGSAVENKGILQKITIALYKNALKKTKTVFFQNEENLKFFKDKKITKARCDLLPGSGVNLQKFAPLEYPNDESTNFVFIARIMKEKGIDQYLDMAKAIKEKYPNTAFHICGSCQEAYQDILKELNDNGTVIYHGLVSDVREVIKECHCTIHPTYYPEGMSNVLLESSACARPIITTNRSGCREIVDDGVNGFVVNQKDSNDLIEKVEKFIALPYEQKRQMGLNGRAKVERDFDRQIVVEKYVGEINEL